MSELNLNIYTPKGTVIRGLNCSSLTVPTTTGEINVLPEHTHILSKLDCGIITAKTSMGERHFACSAGLLKVLSSDITILAFTSEKPEEIDIERAKAAKAKAESRLKGSDELSSLEFIKFNRKLNRANTRLKLSKMYS